MTQNNSAFLFQHRTKFLLLASQNLKNLENPSAIQFYSQHKRQEVSSTVAKMVSELKKCCQNKVSPTPSNFQFGKGPDLIWDWSLSAAIVREHSSEYNLGPLSKLPPAYQSQALIVKTPDFSALRLQFAVLLTTRFHRWDACSPACGSDFREACWQTRGLYILLCISAFTSFTIA